MSGDQSVEKGGTMLQTAGQTDAVSDLYGPRAGHQCPIDNVSPPSIRTESSGWEMDQQPHAVESAKDSAVKKKRGRTDRGVESCNIDWEPIER